MTTQRLAHEEEVFKLAWTTAVATGGGSILLFLGEQTVGRMTFAGLGGTLTILLLFFMIGKDKEIRTATEEQK